MNAAKTSAVWAAGLTAMLEVGKSVINGDDIGTCTSNVVSKGAEAAVSTAAGSAVGELAFLGGAMLNPVIAVPAAVVGGALTCMATGEAVEGSFDEIGDAMGELADTVSNIAADVFDTIGCLFTILF